MYKIDKNTMCDRIDSDKWLLFNTKTGNFATIDNIGYDMMSLLEKNYAVNAIAAHIAKIYDVDERIVASDIEDLFHTMQEKGFLIYD